MKKFITACLIVVALVAFTTKPTLAEPVTLTVMAISGLTVVASLATADKAYQEAKGAGEAAQKDARRDDGVAAAQPKADRVQAQHDSGGTTAGQHGSN
ncbi:MAG: hypothetical protein MUD16_15780 [Desulfobacterales bacterium]|jgi:hypothetical protein|nr:hypothetical protein [Desulfobacterales bacterium]